MLIWLFFFFFTLLQSLYNYASLKKACETSPALKLLNAFSFVV